MIESLTKFIQTTFHSSASTVQLLGAGMFSQAYRFNVDDVVFVVRIGVNCEAFEKDNFAYDHLGQIVSIPRVLTMGEYTNNHYYCISEWKAGRRLADLDKAETERLVPSLFENLLAISRLPVSHEASFGILTGTGQNRKPYASWADFLRAINDFPQTFTPRGDEVYKPWTELYKTTFLDQDLVLQAYQRLLSLLPHLPNERHYVHGDFGHDNALAVADRLTAVLDWAELRCGDWLYDLAYLVYHDSLGIDYADKFQQWAAKNGLPLPSFTERMEACLLSIFLGNIFLEANRGQRDWYEEDVLRYKTHFIDRR